MKKLLFTLLTISISSSLYADAFKLMGGLNLQKYTATPKEESIEWDYKMGYFVGGGFEFDITESKMIAIEVDGLLLYKKGSKKESSDPTDPQFSYSLGTICVPALARIKFKTDSPFYILGGGEASLVMSHKFEKKTGETAEKGDLKENTKTFDFGLVFGCGCEIKITHIQSLFIEGRYNLGLVNILKLSDEFESVKTNALLLILGIKTY